MDNRIVDNTEIPTKIVFGPLSTPDLERVTSLIGVWHREAQCFEVLEARYEESNAEDDA